VGAGPGPSRETGCEGAMTHMEATDMYVRVIQLCSCVRRVSHWMVEIKLLFSGG
jgi:hypothetical protein